MSHISTYTIKIQNIDMFLNICKSKGYEIKKGQHIVKQFGRNEINCIGSVLLPGWRYKIAITENGEIKYDHFGSKAGTMDILGTTIQDYNKQVLDMDIPYDEVSNYYSETLENGDIQVTLEY